MPIGFIIIDSSVQSTTPFVLSSFEVGYRVYWKAICQKPYTFSKSAHWILHFWFSLFLAIGFTAQKCPYGAYNIYLRNQRTKYDTFDFHHSQLGYMIYYPNWAQNCFFFFGGNSSYTPFYYWRKTRGSTPHFVTHFRPAFSSRIFVPHFRHAFSSRINVYCTPGRKTKFLETNFLQECQPPLKHKFSYLWG